MTMQFLLDDEQNSYPVLDADEAQSNWWADLTVHACLKSELEAASRRQTELMELIRKTRRAQPCRAPASSVARAISAQGIVPPSAVEQAQSEDMTVPAAKAELQELDSQVNALRMDLRNLETTILTRDPQSMAETGAILRLLSGMLTSGVRIDEDYLADILETASEPCGYLTSLHLQAAH